MSIIFRPILKYPGGKYLLLMLFSVQICKFMVEMLPVIHLMQMALAWTELLSVPIKDWLSNIFIDSLGAHSHFTADC